MNAERLLEHYERIADAPDAIQRLRRFVLDLAARGKLVPQDASDEPASELLKRLKKARSDLEAAGKMRKERCEPPSHYGGKQGFELPSTWSWARLTEIGQTQTGTSPSSANPDLFGDFIPFIKPADLDGNQINCDGPGLSEIGIEHSRLAAPNSILMVCIGATLGKANTTSRSVCFNQQINSLTPFLDGLTSFIALALKASDFQSLAWSKAGTGTLPIISKGKWEVLPIPLPPLAEQHRIVAKVDELMALCDRLEAARGSREATRDRFTSASLARLNAPDPDTFHDDARFALDALPALTTRPDQIKHIRQTILNLAVRGKLVRQNPKDEPASELLSVKAKLPDDYQRRRKILKKTSVEAPEQLFPQLPASWAYIDIQALYDLNAIIDYADGNHGSVYPRSSEFGESGVTFVTAKDLVDGRVSWDSCAKLSPERASQLTKGWAEGGDVLLTHNATVGRVARVEPGIGRFLLGTSVTFYRLNSQIINADFFYLVLCSPLWQGQLEAIMAQTTRNQVSIQKQAFFKVVVPPLSEQHRIVAKVDALMALCDRLEANLATAGETRRRLLEALLAEALARADAREMEAAE